MLITKSPIWILLDNKYYDVIITYKNDAGELFSDMESILSLMEAMNKATEILKHREDYIYPYSTVDSIVKVEVRDEDNELVFEAVKDDFPDFIIENRANSIEAYDLNKAENQFLKSYEELETIMESRVDATILDISAHISLNEEDKKLILGLNKSFRYLFRTGEGSLIASVAMPVIKGDEIYPVRDYKILSEQSYLINDLKELEIIYIPTVKRYHSVINLQKEEE